MQPLTWPILVVVALSGCAASAPAATEKTCANSDGVEVRIVFMADSEHSPPRSYNVTYRLFELRQTDIAEIQTQHIKREFSADASGCGVVPVESAGQYRIAAYLEVVDCIYWKGYSDFDYDGVTPHSLWIELRRIDACEGRY